MKFKRIAALGVAVVVSALALSGCTTSGTAASQAPQGGTVTVAVTNDLTSLNSNTPQGNLDTNGQVSYLTSAGFYYINNDYSIKDDTTFGTVTKVSDDPLTVQYTLNSGLKWSDGEPITADDMLLGWAINSGYYDWNACNDPNADNTPVYFQIAGSTAGVCDTSLPTISSDNLSMTITYSTPYVDWDLFTPLAQPAHIVAKEAGLSSAADLTALLEKLPAATSTGPAATDPTLAKAAAFVNTGYDITAFPTNPDLLVSSGPFVLSSWTPGQSATFTKNPYYSGGLKPNVDQIVFRVIDDPNAQVTALQNGEVDIINPQASADTLSALNATSATVLTGDQVSYDHLDLNFASSVFKDANVREAFLLTVPRQQILDSIVTPVNPNAQVLDSQIFLPNQDGYSDAVAANGSSEFDSVDIDKAKELLNGATPTVKILYNSKNPNRVDEFQAIQASAAKAGFNVVDGGSPSWSTLLPTGASGAYDASLFGWISPGVGTSQIPQLFSTAGGGNYNSFTAANDLALQTQTTLDPDTLRSQEIQIDTLAFTNFYGLPLFQAPGITAYSARVNGVEYMGNQTGPVWNFWEWSVNQ